MTNRSTPVLAPLAAVQVALAGQHQQIMILLGAAGRDGQAEPSVRAFERFRRYLAAHEAVEQVCLHPLAEGQFGQHTGIVTHRLAEEEQIATLMGVLEGLERSDARCQAVLRILARQLRAHLRAEENQEMTALAALAGHQLAGIARGLDRVEPIVAGWGGGSDRFEDLLEAAHIELLAPPHAPGDTLW